MLKFAVVFSLVVSTTGLAGEAKSLVFDTGVFHGRTTTGDNCALEIKELPFHSVIRHAIQFSINRRQMGKQFLTLRENYKIENTVQNTGIYLRASKDAGIGGQRYDNLALELSDNLITKVSLTLESGLFSVRERKFDCQLFDSINYRVEEVKRYSR